MKASRREVLAMLAAIGAASLARQTDAAQATEAAPFLADFTAFQHAIEQRYGFWDAGRRTMWGRQLTPLRTRARAAQSSAELASVLQAAAESLRDDAIAISDHGARPKRRVPSETDIWPAFHGDVPVIEAVRAAGDADMAGMRPGQTIESVQGVPVARAVEAMAGRRPIPRDRDWALRRLMAGPWTGPFVVDVRDAGKRRRLEIERTPPQPVSANAMLSRRIGEQRDLGYIRLVDVDADARDFDEALNNVREMRALMLDLRDPGNGITRESARAILGRFVRGPSPWLTSERLAPRGTPFTAPVVVLMDRWTAGEAEVLAGSLADVANAKLIGTPTAGHAARMEELRLPRSAVVVRFPIAPLHLATGRKLSEAIEPTIPVDLAAPSGGPGDPILYQALKVLS